jgi:hypothetical protein
MSRLVPVVVLALLAAATPGHAQFSREMRGPGFVARVSEVRNDGKRQAQFEVWQSGGDRQRARQRVHGPLTDAFLADPDGDRRVEIAAVALHSDGRGASLSLVTWDGRGLDDRNVPRLQDEWQQRYRGGDRYFVDRGDIVRQFRAERRGEMVRVNARLDLRRDRWVVDSDSDWGGGSPGQFGSPQQLLDTYAAAMRRDDGDAVRKCFLKGDDARRFRDVTRITITRLLPVGSASPRDSRASVKPGDCFADALHWKRDGDRKAVQYLLRNVSDRRDPKWRIVSIQTN